ncbi:MAG: hypothetical protein ACSLFQ_04710 [Thermoanaerobaculia bacterium]
MDYNTSLSLSLESTVISNIRYSVRGEEEVVLALKSALEGFLSATRPSYWLFCKLSVSMVSATLLALVLISIVVRNFTELVSPLGKTPGWSGVGLVVVIMVTASTIMPLLLQSWTDRLRKYLFPTSHFAWQQGAKRAKHLSFVRSVVLLGFTVGVFASLVATWLARA